MKLAGQLKKQIIKEFKQLDKKSVKQSSLKKPKFVHHAEHYRKLVFNGNIDNVSQIKVKLEIVHSYMSDQSKWDLWKFFRYHVSSMKQTRLFGIQVYFLIKDLTSDKYLGIMSLSSNFNKIKVLHDHVGWDKDTKNHNLVYFLNMSTCVPLQPFGFNFTGGKLISMLAFSREVSEMFIEKMRTRRLRGIEERRVYPILAISTTSLYGKSIQYDRLKCMKYIGQTSGYSSIHIPDDLYDKCKQLSDLMGLTKKTSQYGLAKDMIMQKLLPKIGLSTDLLKQEYPRGIYIGYLYPNSKELMLNKDIDDVTVMNSVDPGNLSSVQEIFDTWFARYASKRYTHLSSGRRLKKEINFYLTAQEKSRSYTSTYRNKKIMELGTKALKEAQPDVTFNSNEIREAGLAIVREQERTKKPTTKRKITSIYDFDKLASLTFNQRNMHLKSLVPQILEEIRKNEHISVVQLQRTLKNDVGVRSLLRRCRR